jgi:hypothetical protein
MATGTVSSLAPNQYQLVATNSPTSGTTVTFSSLSGYKSYLLTFEHLGGFAAAPTVRVRFNGDSTNGKYVSIDVGTTSIERGDDNCILVFTGLATNGNSAFLTIENVLQTAPKYVDGATSQNDGNALLIKGMYFDTAAITSIVVSSSQAFSTGTINLYGIAA